MSAGWIGSVELSVWRTKFCCLLFFLLYCSFFFEVLYKGIPADIPNNIQQIYYCYAVKLKMTFSSGDISPSIKTEFQNQIRVSKSYRRYLLNLEYKNTRLCSRFNVRSYRVGGREGQGKKRSFTGNKSLILNKNVCIASILIDSQSMANRYQSIAIDKNVLLYIDWLSIGYRLIID